MQVWLHTQSPPQHIANIGESEIGTSEKIRAYIVATNARRLTNFKWAGIFEGKRGDVRLCMFWDVDKARAYVARNGNLITSSDD